MNQQEQLPIMAERVIAAPGFNLAFANIAFEADSLGRSLLMAYMYHADGQHRIGDNGSNENVRMRDIVLYVLYKICQDPRNARVNRERVNLGTMIEAFGINAPDAARVPVNQCLATLTRCIRWLCTDEGSEVSTISILETRNAIHQVVDNFIPGVLFNGDGLDSVE